MKIGVGKKSFRRAARYVDWSLNLDLFAIHTSIHTPNTDSRVYTNANSSYIVLSLRWIVSISKQNEILADETRCLPITKISPPTKKKETLQLCLNSSRGDDCRHRSTKVEVLISSSLERTAKSSQKEKKKREKKKKMYEKNERVRRFIPNPKKKKKKCAKCRGANCILFFFYIPCSRESRGKERT